MKKKYTILLIVGVAILILAIISIPQVTYDLKKKQMDTLYTYFHKIQDSIRAKHYPINIDSLKGVVYDERNTVSIYGKLKVLEDSVNAYHDRNTISK